MGARHPLLLNVALLDAAMPAPIVLPTAALPEALLVSPAVARGAVLLSVMPPDAVVQAFTLQHNAPTTVPVAPLAGALLRAPLVSLVCARDAVQHHLVRLDPEPMALAGLLAGMLLDALLAAVTVVLVALPAGVRHGAVHV